MCIGSLPRKNKNFLEKDIFPTVGTGRVLNDIIAHNIYFPGQLERSIGEIIERYHERGLIKAYEWCPEMDKYDFRIEFFNDVVWLVDAKIVANARNVVNDMLKQDLEFVSKQMQIIYVVPSYKKKDYISFINRQVSNTNMVCIPKESIDLSLYGDLRIVRIRDNYQVPDYIPRVLDEKFEDNYGIYKYGEVYYSKDQRAQNERNILDFNCSKIKQDKAMTHRQIIELYPMYAVSKEAGFDAVKNCHILRRAAIEFEGKRTVLPLPMHLCKLLEEYMV